MTRIVLNEALRSLLTDLSRPIEFCDEKGQVVGRFIPEMSEIVGAAGPPPLSEEELRRRESDRSYSTAEVLAYLESLQ